ncbi:MAG TPA: hypothetical protein VFN13_10970 [Rudaea sp.]|nr:hypothetical protein [Rudaea sp.]
MSVFQKRNKDGIDLGLLRVGLLRHARACATHAAPTIEAFTNDALNRLTLAQLTKVQGVVQDTPIPTATLACVTVGARHPSRRLPLLREAPVGAHEAAANDFTSARNPYLPRIQGLHQFSVALRQRLESIP